MAAPSSTESDLDLELELLSGPRVEYACARRLRHRRVLSYLSQEGLHAPFQSLVQQTDAHLCVEHLRRLVAGGMWGESLDYLGRFLPPGVSDDIEARPIFLFLHTLWAFDNIAASVRYHGDVTAEMHRHDFTVCLTVSRNFNLRTILNLILHSPQFSNNLDWGVIRNKAASIACDLAHASPELSRRMLLSSDPATPQDVLPICPRGRRYVKRLPGRPPAHAIAKLYVNKRKSLPSLNPQPGAEDTQSLNQVADLIKECFKASVSLKLLPSSKKQDGLGAPFLKTKISSLTDAATIVHISPVPNAGAPVSCPVKTSDGGTVNTFKGIGTRKHSRTELSTVQEEPDLKRQRTCIKLATDLVQTNAD